MKLPRRNFLHLASSAAALSAMARIASARDYPTRPARIIVGFPAGTAADISARLVGQALSERLGQQFVIDNRPGAGSTIGTAAVVRAPADGYTLLLITTSNAINATLYDNLNFNFIHDIRAVAFISGFPYVMVVTPSLPAKTLAEFIAYAKANPRKINMASQGVGTTPQVCGELLKMMAGIDFTHVPYRGPLMPDLLAGQVQFYFSPMPQPIEYVRDGRLRALGVTTATRSQALPGVPAIGEFVAGYEARGWIGIGAPKKTPAEIVDKLNIAINSAIADPKLKARFADLGEVPTPMTPTDFSKFIANETEKWAKVVKAANIKHE